MNASVNIFNEDGSVSVYRKMSERLPDFLEAYPIGAGYRLVSSSREYLSQSPMLVKIAEMFIEKGTSFDEVRTAISLNKQLFTCELRDESNELVASASALKNVMQYKDYETGETAALQRLMAKLGFGGEVFDADESADIKDQNLNIQKSESKPEHALKVASVSSIEKVVETAPKQTIEKSCAEEKTSSDTSAVAPAILRQLKMQAELAGVECPTVTTTAEAKAALKKVRSIQK